MRRVWLPMAALVLTAFATQAVSQDSDFTQLRHAHSLRILCRAGEPVEVTLHAIAASLGYPDATSYEAIGPDGTSLARGVVSVGKAETITFTSEVGGCCLFAADPQRNAFGVEIKGADWAIDATRSQRVDVIKNARPLHFWVPPGTGDIEFKFTGEEADIDVVRPDGSVAAKVHVPQYAKVNHTLAMNEREGGFWSMKLDLAEDLSISFPRTILGLVPDYPVTSEAYRMLRHQGAAVSFDRRPGVPTGLTRASVAGNAGSVSASPTGSLKLDFGADGSILGLNRYGESLCPPHGLEVGGFFARDVAAGKGIVPLAGTATPSARGLRIQGSFPGLDVELKATVSPAQWAARVDGEIRDLRGEDRAISLYFILPVDATGGLWHDDVVTSRTITGDGIFSNDAGCSAGANGYHSMYPLACVTGKHSVAMGINPQQPRIFRLGYEPDLKRMFCVFDLGLSPEVTKSPSRAGFSLSVFTPGDAQWGFRSALERYYQIYPDTFEKRIPKDGGWICWRSLEDIPDIDKTGMMYHWGVSTGQEGRAVRHDDEVGAYSLIYNDSVRFFADLGAFDARPSAAEANARFKGFLDAPDPLAYMLEAPATATGRSRWLSLKTYMSERDLDRRAKRCQEAVKRSYATDADGAMIPGYIINRKGWGPENWWTGRLTCNPDPDIPGGYGRFLLNDVIGTDWRYLEKHGAHPDGIGLDNYFVNANNLNYRREHFQYADIPLTFDRAGRLAICGDFQLLEWVKWLKEELEKRDCYLIPNAPHSGWPFFTQYMDIFGLELNYEAEGVQFYHRALAGKRPVVTLPLQPEHYTEDWVKLHIPAGMIPGGYGAPSNLTDPAHPYRVLLEKYMPTLQAMSTAGWEPVTYASGPFRLERFGTGGTVYWSVRNPAEESVSGKVFFNLCAAGFKPGQKVAISNALDGTLLTTCESVVQYRDCDSGSPVTVQLELDAGDSTVLKAEALSR